MELLCEGLQNEGLNAEDVVHSAKSGVAGARKIRPADQVDGLRSYLVPYQQGLLDLSQKKGASTWLSVLSIAQHGFDLH